MKLMDRLSRRKFLKLMGITGAVLPFLGLVRTGSVSAKEVLTTSSGSSSFESGKYKFPPYAGDEVEMSTQSTAYVPIKQLLFTMYPKIFDPKELLVAAELKTSNPLYPAVLGVFIDELLVAELSSYATQYEVKYEVVKIDYLAPGVHQLGAKLKTGGAVAFNRLLEAYLR